MVAFAFMLHITVPRPHLGHVGAPLNKKLRNGRLQTFDVLIYDEITDFVVAESQGLLNSTLVLPYSQGTCFVSTDVYDEMAIRVIMQK